MSDIPRYRPVSNDRYGITDDVDGKLCEYRDYARLKAEVERLRASSFVTAVPVEQYERLKAEVERLTKAHSDALADFWAIHKGYFDLKAEVERLRKEGNGQP
jgi:CRISPR/Cas system-associated endoribonuclease Cas2